MLTKFRVVVKVQTNEQCVQYTFQDQLWVIETCYSKEGKTEIDGLKRSILL